MKLNAPDSTLWVRVQKGIAECLIVSNLFFSTGCATLFHGWHERVDVKAQPPGTEVTVYRWDGEVVGGPVSAPGSDSFRRPSNGQPYLAIATKDGYCPHYWVPKYGVTVGGALDTVWLLLTLSLGAVVVAAVDSKSGAFFKFTEAEFNSVVLEAAPCAS